MREGAARLAHGGSLAFRDQGPIDGAPLLLIRPLGGTLALWQGLIDALDPGLRVICFDARGSGGSVDLRACTSVPALARDALRVLDALGLRCASVLGQSLGSFVALHLAGRHAARVTRLILVSAALYGASFARAPLRRDLANGRCLLRPRHEVEVCLLHQVLSPDFRAREPARVREIEHLLRALPTPKSTLLRHLLAAARFRGQGAAAALRCPVQLVMGGRDGLLGTPPQRALCQALGAECHTLAGVGHDVSLEAPAALAALVSHFVASSTRAG